MRVALIKINEPAARIDQAYGSHNVREGALAQSLAVGSRCDCTGNSLGCDHWR